MTEGAPSCRRCGRPMVTNRGHAEIFEGMHRLCFHLEDEHPGAPDMRCADPGCPQWQREVLEEKLAQLGHDPQAVIAAAVAKRTSRGDG